MTATPVDLDAIDVDALTAALEPGTETPQVRIARRATVIEARKHFEAGGDVLVSERGHKATQPVGPNTTVHNSRATTWADLRQQVTEWRNRYPNQRYYIVPNDDAPTDKPESNTGDHGYVCKRCGGPAPMGVGYVAVGAAPAAASAEVTECGCGYSRTRLAPDEVAPPAAEAINTALHKLYPGDSKAATERRKKIWDAIWEELNDVVVWGVELAGLLPIGDPIVLGNAVIEVDAHGDAVSFTTTGRAWPIWEPK